MVDTTTHICKCTCRHNLRWFQRILREDGLTFKGTYDNYSEAEDRYYARNYQYNDYSDAISKLLSVAGAHKSITDWSNCTCCERHQTNRLNEFDILMFEGRLS
jgi:hypothetical protein